MLHDVCAAVGRSLDGAITAVKSLETRQSAIGASLGKASYEHVHARIVENLGEPRLHFRRAKLTRKILISEFRLISAQQILRDLPHFFGGLWFFPFV